MRQRKTESISEYDFSQNTVVYVGNFGMPNTNAPGKRVYGNSIMLSKLGKKVLMVGTDNCVKDETKEITKNISYVSFPQYGKFTGKKYFDWLKAKIDYLEVKPDIIVRYGSPGLAIFDLYLYLYCRKNRIPVVVDVVDWLSVDSNNLLFKLLKAGDNYLEKAVFNKLGNGIITISSYLNNYYDKYFENKIVIPPLVEKYTYQETVNKTPQIVYAGIPFRKGEKVSDVHCIKDRLDIAVLALRELEKERVQFDFHIIGVSKEEYLIAFPEQVDLLADSEHISFYGQMSMQKAQEMIKAMDYSILLRERTRGSMAGFPTKLVESMSLSVPVITTDTSDITKYIENGVNGFIVDISNVEILKQQLRSILALNSSIINNIKRNICSDQEFQVNNYIKPFESFIALVNNDSLIDKQMN